MVFTSIILPQMYYFCFAQTNSMSDKQTAFYFVLFRMWPVLRKHTPGDSPPWPCLLRGRADVSCDSRGCNKHRSAKRWPPSCPFLASQSPKSYNFQKRFLGALYAPASHGPRRRSRWPLASVPQLRCSGALFSGPAPPLLSLERCALLSCAGAARSSVALVAHAPCALVSLRVDAALLLSSPLRCS